METREKSPADYLKAPPRACRFEQYGGGDETVAINYDTVNKFVSETKGDVEMFNPDGGWTVLKSGEIDKHAAFGKATIFVHRGTKYTPEEFDKLLSRHEA